MIILRKKFLLIPIVVLFFTSLNIFLLNLDALELISLLSYLLLTWLFGVTIFPLVRKSLPHMGAASYALAKTLGVACFFYILWLLNHIEILRGPWTSTTLLLITIFYFFKYAQNDFSHFILKNMKEVLSIEIIFFSIFLIVLSLYAAHPELYWGEKPMDFTLLNYFTRFPSLPPADPWFSGQRMHYYYWGYFYLAQLGNMAGLGSEISYGSGLALSAALFACGLYGVFSFVLKEYRYRFCASILMFFSASLAAFLNFFKEGFKVNMQYFWSSSRVFSEGGFAEYPSWSFLFADLHAHVLCFPFSVLFLNFIFYGFKFCWKKFSFKESKLFLGAYSFSFGLLILVNGWDFVIYSLLASLLWVLQGPAFWRKSSYWLSFLAAHITGLLIVSPVFLTLIGGAKKEIFLSKSPVNSFSSLFLFFGGWFLIICFCAPFFLRKMKKEWLFLKAPFLKFLLATLGLILIAERVVFMDRINTIFKTYTNVYIWLGIIAISWTFYLHERFKRKRLLIYMTPIYLVFTCLLLGSALNTYVVLNSRPYGKIGTGLKGSAYLQRFNLEDYKIIDWLKNRTIGLPVILEKDSNSFNHSASRISMHTGLPTFLGWHNHVRLRGASSEDIEQRRSMVAYLYHSSDALKVHEQLMQLGINFIILGKFERSELNPEAIVKFDSFSDLFKPLLKIKDRVVIYGVGDYQTYLRSDKIVGEE